MEHNNNNNNDDKNPINYGFLSCCAIFISLLHFMTTLSDPSPAPYTCDLEVTPSSNDVTPFRGKFSVAAVK